ncbi:MAG: carbamoyltransferase HypF [Clostridiales bacterium]|nr:carbamoyltransferase HypF [Clostridiales bacterium]
MSSNNGSIKRYCIQLSGIVQGVGFRPYVYNKAKEYSIYGWVNNAGASLVIDAEGEKGALKYFILDIVKNPPVLACVEKAEIRQKKYVGYKKFEIRPSNMEDSKIKRVSPDIGVCGIDMLLQTVPNAVLDIQLLSHYPMTGTILP